MGLIALIAIWTLREKSQQGILSFHRHKNLDKGNNVSLLVVSLFTQKC
jgi:hypothetical protein